MHNSNSYPTLTHGDSHFSWMRDPEFIPPDRDGALDACMGQAFSEPRSGELSTLLSSFLDSLINTIGASAGVVRLLSPDRKTLQIISSAALSSNLQEEAESFIELDCEANDRNALSPLIHATDISNCAFRNNCRLTQCCFLSLVSTPLTVPDQPDSILGVLTVFFEQSREIASRSICYVNAVAEMMGASIEHTRLNREALRIERLAARQEIANEIHDSLSQTLTYARMRVRLLTEAIESNDQFLSKKYAQDIDESLEIGQKSARVLITDFRFELDPGGLLPALNTLTEEFCERNPIKLEYRNRLVDLQLPLEHEIQVYHIVREALTNIARHSGASHARLFVDRNYGYYAFIIEDNGSGTFSPVEGHYGALIMRERAQRIGGEIRIVSTSGIGTQVQLYFPEPSPDWRTEHE